MEAVKLDTGTITYPAIYKRTSTGAVQVWYQELLGNAYRTVSGQLEGEKTISGWVVAEPTNVGRSNERNAEQQARFEVDANYRKKLEQGGYHKKLENIDKPKFFKPMLAHKFEAWAGPCYSQRKLDGMRCIATAEGLFSRNGKPILSVPHIVEALKPFFSADPDLVLDGELYNHDLKDDFNKIMSLVKKATPCKEAEGIVQYHIYDMPSHTGTFFERWNALCDLCDPDEDFASPSLHLVTTTYCDSEMLLDSFHGIYLAEGYEGQMVRLDTPYEQKRSKSLLKRKEFKDGEYTVVDIEEGLGNWAGYAKRAILQLPDGRKFGAGIKGSQEFCLDLLKNKQSVIGNEATVRFFALTPDVVPRFPVVYEFNRDDK